MKNWHTPINTKVLQHIALIYRRLTNEKLLEKCVKGFIKKNYWSLQSDIQQKCNKAENVSKKLALSGVAQSVGGV